MSEKGENIPKEIVYPTILDVILYRGKEYQVVGSIQTKNIKKDVYKLRDPQDSKVLIEVTGAKFDMFDVKEEPKSVNIYRKDENIMVTGELIGGKKEILKIS